ncbi:MAG: MerR family transcriptional regulator [Deltaproteobacteria bacterium]|nr:MerR family transcriptional regulator [Deltaproteobacteria bacterium]
MKIGTLAKAADSKVVTIRYYEKLGLLEAPPRSLSGQREYSAEDLERLKFIRHCRYHGFSLAEVKILIKLRKAPEGNCAPVDNLIDSLIAKLETQIDSVNRLRQNLITLKGCCHGGSIADCAILKGLSQRDSCPCSAC